MSQRDDAWDTLTFLSGRHRTKLEDLYGSVDVLQVSLDTVEDAVELLHQILDPGEFEAYGGTLANQLLDWSVSMGTFAKRQRRLRCGDMTTTLGSGHPHKPFTTLQEEFEAVIADDPKCLLDIAKQFEKRRRQTSREGDVQERMDKERRCRERFALELATIVDEAMLPVSAQINDLKDPAAVQYVEKPLSCMEQIQRVVGGSLRQDMAIMCRRNFGLFGRCSQDGLHFEFIE